jgi:hypothetical protein
MKKYYYKYFIIVGLLFSFQAKAEDVITLTNTEEYQVITNEYIEVLEDTTGRLTIDDMLKPTVASGFYVVSRNYALNEHVGSIYWARFKIKNLSGNQKKWLLEILDSRQNDIQLYQLDEQNKFIKTQAGINGSFNNREYEHKNFIFEIHPSREPKYFYLRIKSDARTSFIMKVSNSKFLLEYGLNEYYLLGLYYGILAMMAIYSLFVFFMIKEKVYLFYLIYTVSWMYSSMLADGTGFQYIWPDIPLISKIGIYISRPLLLTVFVFYSLEFLKNPDINILNRKYVLYSLALYILFYPIQFIFDLALIHNTLFLIPFIIIFYYTIKSLRSGYKPARYFLIGNSVILLSVTLTLLKYNGLLDFLSPFWTLEIIIVYSTNIAMVMEIVILSFAMADRIKFFKIEKEKTQQLLIGQLEENHKLTQKVNRELEEKVIERTQEIEEKRKQIEEANLKLQEQAIQINEMNARLDLDNWKLKKSIIEEKESRIKFKEISFEEFKQVYPNENICFQFLEELKWEKGYTCKRCGNDKYGKGNHQFSRRCTKCRYDESVTTDTLFHKCKFDINKALYIVVMVNRYGDKQSISELANELELRVATCWNFAQKALKVRNSKEYAKLDDESKFRFLIQQEIND